MNMMIMRSRFN